MSEQTTAQRLPDGGWTWLTPLGDQVTVYRGLDELWRWRVQARNGENVGSGEGHPDVRNALEGAMRYHAPEHPGTWNPDQDGVARPSLPDQESPWLRPLPDGDLEATWPTTWFSYLERRPEPGDPVLVGGARYVVAARGAGRPDRIVVRLHRAEVRHA